MFAREGEPYKPLSSFMWPQVLEVHKLVEGVCCALPLASMVVADLLRWKKRRQL